jgi:MYXO-CTERM domain-containing protein
MQLSLNTVASIAAISVSITGSSFAHISYSGRNFGTLTNVASSINNQLVSSGYGWADATDADWGDSHRTRFFRFNVAADGTQVRIAVQRNANASATGAQGTFLPGFSLYSGLAQLSPNPLGHDGSALSVQWLTTTFGNTAGFGLGGSGKEGVLNALGNWSVGNSVSNTIVDPSDFLRSFTYVGHAADGASANYGSASGINGDGTADGSVYAVFTLAAGDYSLSVGGADYAKQLTETGPTFPTYGIDVSVGVVPAPGAVALLAIAGIAGSRRRKEVGA